MCLIFFSLKQHPTYKLIIAAQELTLEFGRPSPTGFPYALATVEGQTWIFEFPRILYLLLVRDLFHPLMGGGE